MRVVGSALLLLLLAAAPAAAADRVLRSDGRVGDLRVGVARMAAVRAQESRAPQVRGTRWRFACGHDRGSEYVFDDRGVLRSFSTTCRSWRTADGTRVGDGRAIAEFHERAGAADAGCGLRIRRGRLEVRFATRAGAVRELAVGPERC